MFSVKVRDHIMIAHSFSGATFGPAQALHGATYIVDVAFKSKTLVPGDNIVIDIGKAHEVLKEVLADLNYRNLDEHSEMQGQNTTTEFLAKFIHEKIWVALGKHNISFEGKVKVTLGESNVAWASYSD